MELCLKPRKTGVELLESIRRFANRLSAALSGAARAANAKVDFDRAAVSERAGELFSRYGNSILRLAVSYLHRQEDAEDILQETMIRFLESPVAFLSEGHEKAWVLTVAANLSKNRIKYNSYRDGNELLEELVAEEKEDLAFVWEAVMQLPENYREAVHLFYQEGYSTREIAQILKRKEATVRSDLKRGRERLKEILREEYDFHE